MAQTSDIQLALFTSSSASSEEYEEGEEIPTLYEDRESHRNHASEADGNLTAEKCGDGVDGFGGCRENLNLSVKEQVDLYKKYIIYFYFCEPFQ